MNFFYKSQKLRLRNIYCFILLGCCSINCKKLVEVGAPVTSVNAENVYATDATATAVLTGLYASVSQISTFSGIKSISSLSGLSADELTLYGGSTDVTLLGYYQNTLKSTPLLAIGSEHWAPMYNYIFICNAAIEGLSKSTALTSAVKQQLMGEAKFMRAFFYFYLVNLFGDVPLATSTVYSTNAALSRASQNAVYQQIVTDLKEAQELLSSTYLDGNLQNYTDQPERVRPTKWAATALLARVYLYMKDYNSAETEATAIISQTSLYSLPVLNNAFLKNSTEAIWQLRPVKLGHNTEDAWTFILPSTGPTSTAGLQDHPVYLSTFLLNAFEADDQRRSNWIDSVTVDNTTYYYPYKYKSATLDAPVTEYLTALRLAEQYLIRAEARAQTGNVSGAITDLNTIRTRAGLPGTTANTPAGLLTAVLHEKQVELFTEWGHRWLDLKRTNKVGDVMSTVTQAKGGTWEATDELYPLPLNDLQKAPNLEQNPGY